MFLYLRTVEKATAAIFRRTEERTSWRWSDHLALPSTHYVFPYGPGRWLQRQRGGYEHARKLYGDRRIS